MTPEKLTIFWAVFGAFGTMSLTLIAWGIKRLITLTLSNTSDIRLIQQMLSVAFKDIDGVAAVVGTKRSRGQKINENKGDYDEE